MAIVQISKIQQRSGNLVDLPQLDDAEFGWASDEKRLFIGKSTPNENIEVLTSYSNISFSQINGSDGGNFNISNAQNGQLLTYVASTDTWENFTGSSQLGNSKLQLTDVSNIQIGGGAIGYVLETDGTGNLSWTPKGSLYTPIKAISNANPMIMTVDANTPYTNNTVVTISGVLGTNANTIVNGKSFYIQVAVDFATSGNVGLYTSSGNSSPADGTGLVATANTGIATSLTGGSGGSGAVGGSNTTVLFNNQNISDGSADLTFDFGASTKVLTVNGNANVGNLNATGTVSGSRLVSNVATGTAPLTVTSTTPVSNLAANVSLYGQVTTQTSGTYYPILVSGNSTANYALGSNANISFNVATGNLSTVLLSVTSNANVGNLGTAGLIVATGNVTGGNLVTGGVLSVTGNSNVGNLGTAGLIVATGNVTGGNLVTSGAISVTGNANVGNLGTAQVLATANVTTPQLISNVATGTAPLVVTSTTKVANLNVDFIDGYNTSTTSAVNSVVVRDASASFSANVITANSFLGTVDTAAQPNITSVGNLNGLVVSGDITPSANITYDLGNATHAFRDLYLSGNTIKLGNGGATISANATAVIITGPGGNAVPVKPGGANAQVQYNDDGIFGGNPGMTFNEGTTTFTANNFVATSRANLGAVGNVYIGGGSNNQVLTTNGSGNLSWANSTGGYYLHTQSSANTTWTVVHNLNQRYVTVEPIDNTGNSYTGRYDFPTITYNNANALTLTWSSAQTGLVAVTGGGFVYANVSGNTTPGGFDTYVQFNDAGVMNGSASMTFVKATGTLSATLFSGSGANLTNLNASNISSGTLPSARLSGSYSINVTTAGTVTTNAQPNITSVGTLTVLNVNGTITATNITANTGIFSGNGAGLTNIPGGNVTGTVANATYAVTAGTANSVAGANVSGQVANALVAGTVYTNAQPNITSVGTLTGLTLANASTITGNNMTLTTGANTNSGTITGNWTLSTGSRMQATYADLAEYYEADFDYEPGTVLQFGGEKEVTIAEDGTSRVAGVVSTDPAYAMNAKCPGIAVEIALQGRVPTKVRGIIRKGDMMISGGNGFARPCSSPQMGTVIGKALQDFDGIEGVIEIAVGRL